MNARLTLVLLCLSIAANAFAAEDFDQLFRHAVEAVDFEFHKSWAYTETHVDSEHVWVGRFDPRRPEDQRWQLLTVNDRTPTEEEMEEYQEERAGNNSDDGEDSVEAMVKPDSVRLIEETAEYWLLGFDPGEDDHEVVENLEATIRISKAGSYLEFIDLRSRSPIKPAVGIKIAKLITRLTFGPAADGGPVVPLSTQVEVKGRAYLFISFDEQELFRNSDFEYVGEE
jgi:hypothetical protein